MPERAASKVSGGRQTASGTHARFGGIPFPALGLRAPWVRLAHALFADDLPHLCSCQRTRSAHTYSARTPSTLITWRLIYEKMVAGWHWRLLRQCRLCVARHWQTSCQWHPGGIFKKLVASARPTSRMACRWHASGSDHLSSLGSENPMNSPPNSIKSTPLR